jgi:hypothetical protein
VRFYPKSIVLRLQWFEYLLLEQLQQPEKQQSLYLSLTIIYTMYTHINTHIYVCVYTYTHTHTHKLVAVGRKVTVKKGHSHRHWAQKKSQFVFSLIYNVYKNH